MIEMYYNHNKLHFQSQVPRWVKLRINEIIIVYPGTILPLVLRLYKFLQVLNIVNIILKNVLTLASFGQQKDVH